MLSNRTLIRFSRLTVLLCFLLCCSNSTEYFLSDIGHFSDSLLQRGDTLSAIDALQSRIAQNHPPGYAFITLGHIYRNQGTILSRLRSQLILEDGLRKYPHNPELLLELGKTYYEQTFFADACRCFSKVLAGDSTYCDAYYYIGANHFRKWRRNRLFLDEIHDAIFFLRKAVACSPKSPDWHFKLALAHYVIGMKDSCMSICRTILAEHPAHANTFMLMGTLFLENSSYDSSAAVFRKAFSLLEASEIQRYGNIGILLLGEEKQEYTAASKSRKEIITRRYWIVHDPDPASSINERYLEHLSRVFLADMYFSLPASNLRGSDSERGRLLIKLGWPSGLETDLGKGVEGRMERWMYGFPHGLISFEFTDQFLNDDFTISMSKEIMKRDFIDVPPTSAIASERSSSAGRMYYISFRGQNSLADIYLVLSFQPDSVYSILHRYPDSALPVRGVLFNNEAEIADNFTSSIYSLISDSCLSEPIMYMRPMGVPCGSFHFVLSVGSEEPGRSLGFSIDFDTADYLSEDLILSDLLLFKKEYSECFPVLRRNNRAYHFNPANDYNPSDPLAVYFEIYNLGLRNLKSQYEISYAIYPAFNDAISTFKKILFGLRGALGIGKSKSPIIVETIAGSGVSHTQCESQLINIDSLGSGSYILKISVLDHLSKETANALGAFSVSYTN